MSCGCPVSWERPRDLLFITKTAAKLYLAQHFSVRKLPYTKPLLFRANDFQGKGLVQWEGSPSRANLTICRQRSSKSPLFLPEFGSFLALYRNSGTQLMMLTHVCPVGSGTEVGNHLLGNSLAVTSAASAQSNRLSRKSQGLYLCFPSSMLAWSCWVLSSGWCLVRSAAG